MNENSGWVDCTGGYWTVQMELLDGVDGLTRVADCNLLKDEEKHC